MSEETDHDILIELRTDVKHLINAHEELKAEVHNQCFPRIAKVEACQNRWIGRDGVIAGLLGVFGGAIITVALWFAGVKT